MTQFELSQTIDRLLDSDGYNPFNFDFEDFEMQNIDADVDYQLLDMDLDVDIDKLLLENQKQK